MVRNLSGTTAASQCAPVLRHVRSQVHAHVMRELALCSTLKTMRVTPANVREFQKHCKEVYDLDLSYDRAEKVLVRLHRLYRLLSTRRSESHVSRSDPPSSEAS